MNAAIPPLLATHPLFKGVDGKNLAEATHTATLKTHKRKAQLVRQGDTAPALVLVISGRVSLTRTSAGGMEVVVRFASPGDSLMEEAILTGQPSSFGAITENNSQTLHLPATTVQTLLASSQAFTRNLLHAMAHRGNAFMYSCETLVSRSAEDRLMGFLVQTMLETGGPRRTFDLPYSKSAIARHLGMTPETFSRCLPLLEKRGIHIKGKTVTLAADTSLCAGCDPLHAQTCSRRGHTICPIKTA